jgi:hypothetical protein
MARAAGVPARAARPERAPRRGAAKARAARPRRLSGPAPAARAAALSATLPARALSTPFARAARARTNGLLDALLAGRGWIALIGLLLTGIVFFNVDLLRMNRDIARMAERAATLDRTNARLRREASELASSEQIQERAGALGLFLPAPGEVRYLRAYPGADARKAAKRITPPTQEEAMVTTEATVTTEPAATTDPMAPTDQSVATEATAVSDPAVTTDPAATTEPEATPTTETPVE